MEEYYKSQVDLKADGISACPQPETARRRFPDGNLANPSQGVAKASRGVAWSVLASRSAVPRPGRSVLGSAVLVVVQPVKVPLGSCAQPGRDSSSARAVGLLDA